MRALFLALIGFNCVWVTPLGAIPPPLIDPRFKSADAAISELDPFLGTWIAERAQLGPYGQDHFRYMRSLRRVGDVIIFVTGSWVPTGVYIIEYNLETRGYRLSMPGYTHTREAEPGAVTKLNRLGPLTIQWVDENGSIMESTGRNLRHTVTIRDGKWNEKQDWVYKGGRVEGFMEVELARDPSVPTDTFK